MRSDGTVTSPCRKLFYPSIHIVISESQTSSLQGLQSSRSAAAALQVKSALCTYCIPDLALSRANLENWLKRSIEKGSFDGFEYLQEDDLNDPK